MAPPRPTPTPRERLERVLAHLSAATGLDVEADAEYHPVASSRPELPDVTAIVLPDVPAPGMLTGVTYGLSLVDHAAWRDATVELVVTVSSGDRSWVRAAAYVAERLRGRSGFAPGDLFDLGEPVAPGSAIDGYVVGPLPALGPGVVDVGERRPLQLVGLHPVHAAERAAIKAVGVEAWLAGGVDTADVGRVPPA